MKINSRFTKVAVAAGLVVATGAGVLGLTGFASAQVARSNSAVVAKSDRPSPIAEAVTALGMTEAELKTELQAGKSIADVAKAKNIDLDTVIAKLTAAFKAHLDEEVASGKHTQAEADAKLAEFKTRVTEMVNAPGLPMRGGKGGHGPGGHGGKGGHGPQKFATATLATTLKLTETELQTELKSGKTIKQIADAQNVDIADVKATLTSDFKAHLDEEVASGEHTQAEADAKLAEFTTRLDDMVNGVRPVGGKGGHGPGGKGGRGGHGHGGGHQFSATPGAPAQNSANQGA
jgi:DNA-binding CsgD family transcriptional regulator